MGTTAIRNSAPSTTQATARLTPVSHGAWLLALWAAIFAASLSTPPLLDDADATHAQAAQAILRTGDWVTLHVNGIRYLEKAPLPYWIAALSLRAFPEHAAFAIHLPLALTVLGLALLAYAWSRRAFGQTTALYAATFVLTSVGVFLFTRIFIPDALLSLLLALSLYLFLYCLRVPTATAALELRVKTSAILAPYLLWTTLALAVLTKGLVALVFFFATALCYLLIRGQVNRIGRLRPFTGLLVLLAIAAPWHILAGLRNAAGPGHPGFFWFYFVNEHVLRFLGRRTPRDFNKLPAALYWLLHLVWLFPWSLFAPAAIVAGLRARRAQLAARELGPEGHPLSRLELLRRRNAPATTTLAEDTVLLLGLFSAIVLVFFSLSTNQEYYTFPAYLPLLMLIAAGLTRNPSPLASRISHLGFAAFTALGLAAAAVLAWGLWASRHLPFIPDIGSLLAHRSVGNYTLSLSHFFDLTGPSFAALRLPAALAAVALTLGPIAAWLLHNRRRAHAAFAAVALTSATFLIAAHVALVRFAPMLSSYNFAANIQSLEQDHRIGPDTQVLLFGDQAFGSSIPFYLGHPVFLVDGRSTSMLFGSTFADAPPVFLSHQQLVTQWGTGERKLLFVPLEQRDAVTHLLGNRALLLQEQSGKALYTDRPLTPRTAKDIHGS
jgi:4-amino-4-deoxy-L-arabinose transferase-like glycosyltransferase